jgi:DNA-directed RNA polymerase sigma subunit (sigma70/sigma32)
VYRWYVTPKAAEYLADGDRGERARRTAMRLEEWERVSAAAVQSRQAALAAVRAELAVKLEAHALTRCWRYDKIIELRQARCSLQEIGDVFGLTRERVRQIEAGREQPCRCAACQARMLDALRG